MEIYQFSQDTGNIELLAKAEIHHPVLICRGHAKYYLSIDSEGELVVWYSTPLDFVWKSHNELSVFEKEIVDDEH